MLLLAITLQFFAESDGAKPPDTDIKAQEITPTRIAGFQYHSLGAEVKFSYSTPYPL